MSVGKTVNPGDQFGALTVLSAPVSKRTPGRRARRYCLCRCACGTSKTVLVHELLSGHRKSCGCRVQRLRHHPRDIVAIRRSMIRRCTDPGHRSFVHYGGRGIRVCQRWIDSIDAFLTDVGRRPSKKHTLDRVDNDGDYEPGNVRWATALEQHNNTRGCTLMTHNGETKTMSEWARHYGVDYGRFKERLHSGIPLPYAGVRRRCQKGELQAMVANDREKKTHD